MIYINHHSASLDMILCFYLLSLTQLNDHSVKILSQSQFALAWSWLRDKNIS